MGGDRPQRRAEDGGQDRAGDVVGKLIRTGPIAFGSTWRTSTRPSLVFVPTITCSRRPVRNAPITGPVVRLNGYSMMSGAVRTSVRSAIEAAR